MAVLQNTRAEVTGINNLMVDNNPISVIAAIKSYGINVTDTSRDALVNLLEHIFDTNKTMWVGIVKKFQYDSTVKNYTTDAALVQNLSDTYNKQYGNPVNAKLNLSNLFSGIGDFIGGSSTTTGNSSITTVTPAVKAGTVIAIVVVIVAVIVFISYKK